MQRQPPDPSPARVCQDQVANLRAHPPTPDRSIFPAHVRACFFFVGWRPDLISVKSCGHESKYTGTEPILCGGFFACTYLHDDTESLWHSSGFGGGAAHHRHLVPDDRDRCRLVSKRPCREANGCRSAFGMDSNMQREWGQLCVGRGRRAGLGTERAAHIRRLYLPPVFLLPHYGWWGNGGGPGTDGG